MNAHVGADGIEFRPDDTTVHGLHFPKTTLNMGKLPMPRPGDVARRGVIGAFASSSSSGSRNIVHAKGLSALKDSRTHEIGQIALGRGVFSRGRRAAMGRDQRDAITVLRVQCGIALVCTCVRGADDEKRGRSRRGHMFLVHIHP